MKNSPAHSLPNGHTNAKSATHFAKLGIRSAALIICITLLSTSHGASSAGTPYLEPVSDHSSNQALTTAQSYMNQLVRWAGGMLFAPLPATAPVAMMAASDYIITTGKGAIERTSTNIGNRCDDCSTTITLPFAYTLYDQSFTSAKVSANGILEFAGNSGGTHQNSCLPAANFTYSIFAHWDDLITSAATDTGIFTSTSGKAPNRIFNIEWRAAYNNNRAQRVNFQVRLYEGQKRFDIIYGAIAQAGSAATVGVQQNNGVFTQSACNAGGIVPERMLTFTAPAAPNSPVANADSYTATEDTALTVNLPGVLANDTSINTNPLTAVIVNQPVRGTVALNANGAFTYTPNPDHHGADSFSYKAVNGTLESNPATVSINVSAVNDPPTANADSKSTPRNTALTFPESDLSANDHPGPSNESGQPLTVTTVTQTGETNGTVALSNNSITYTPRSGFSGRATFQYTVCDNGATGGVADAKCVNGIVAVNVLANLTIGKPATQSSTYPDPSPPIAGRAVDGNTNGITAEQSFSHTNSEAEAWWQVDLGSVQSIETIKVWNRTDCCADRLTNFYVFVSDQPFTSTALAATQSQAGVTSYHTPGQGGAPTVIPVERTGRYVRVQLVGTNILTLSEVEVWGLPSAPPSGAHYTSWSTLTNGSNLGNGTVSKTSATQWDFTAIAAQQLIAGDGYFESTAASQGQHLTLVGADGQERAIRVGFGSWLGIYENNAPYPVATTDGSALPAPVHAAGDRYRIEISGGTLRYVKYRGAYRTVIYTSTLAVPAYPLKLRLEISGQNYQWQNTVVSDAVPETMPLGLVAHWKFDEGNGTTAADASEGGHTGTLQTPGWSAGRVGAAALNFDGADDRLSVPRHPRIANVSNNFTLAFWASPRSAHEIDPENTTSVGGVAGQRYALGPASEISYDAGAGVSVGTNGVSIYEHSSGYMPATLVHQAPINGWTHIAVIFDNKQPKLYVNGTLVRTGLTTPRVNVHISPADIGGMAYGYFNGLLDDMRIYDRALSLPEVQALMAANTPPTISITSPAPGASVTAPVTITADAADSGGAISKVDFYHGAQLLGTDTTAPYSYTWSTIAAGSYTVTAKATDNLGATTTSTPISFTAVRPNGLPTVNLTNPTTGATFNSPANITIEAAASDSDGTVSQVEFYNNSMLLFTDTTAPYSYLWPNVTVGRYTLTARAIDNAGAADTSSEVAITVTSPTNTPPTVNLTSPTNGQTFAAPADIKISATAADSDGTISKVEYYAGTTLIGTDIASPYGFTWSSVAAGSYVLTAKATDNAGATTTSSAINITVSGSSSTSPFVEQGGQVVVEAENHHVMISRGNQSWAARTSPAGYVGTGMMVAEPDSGTLINTGYTTTSPELQYKVHFTTPGTYYVWLRVLADGDDNNSVHVGLNGQEVATADRLSMNSYGAWTWTQSTIDGPVATLVVSSAGVHTINVWLREDGYRLDRLLLTTSATAPSGNGPAESLHVDETPTNTPPRVSLTSPTNGATFTTPADIMLSADAADSDGTISKVEFYSGTTLVATEITTPYSLTWSNVAAGSYILTAKATDNAGATTTSSAVSITVSGSGSGAPPSTAFVEQSGQVVVEAENYHTKLDRGGQSWAARTSPAGYVGTGMMVAEPDSGTLINTGYTTTSPELQYKVHFTTPGTYYVWLRVLADGDDNNSVHVGLNGQEVATADRLSMNSYGAWTWTQSTIDGPVATLVVSSAGVHTINVWLREDGYRLDRLLLTTSTTAPSGIGPAQSPRAFAEQGGQVVMEAENHHAMVSRSNQSWAARTSPAGYVGTGMMVAEPNNNVQIDTGYTTTSPELQYQVQFATPGTYNVWLRSLVDAASDNSVHIGLDGQAVTTADRMTVSTFGAWAWAQSTSDGPVATIVVGTAGVHTINVWLREDGFRLDRLLLTTSTTAPSGNGPTESPR